MTTTKKVVLLATALLVSACYNRRKVEVVSTGEVVATRVDAQTGSTLPAGADLRGRLDQTLALADTKAGDNFSITVSTAVMALNGEVVVPRGARIHGKVLGLTQPGEGAKNMRLSLDVQALEIDGKRYPLKAFVTEVSEVPNKNAFIGGTKMTLRVSESVLLR